MFNKKTFLSMITSILLISLMSQAETTAAQPSSQDLLIKKLTQVLLNLAPSDPSHTAVVLRLADLHSERARILSMKELNEGCTVCKAGDADRTKALAYYSDAVAKTPQAQKGKVFLQLGHLYEMTGQAEKAEKNYQEILGVSNNPLELAEAHLSLAETAFRKNNFESAKMHYEKVLATEGASSQGLAAYRKAWCDFKLGQMDQAIEGLKLVLTKPQYQSRLANSKGVADPQFLEEVSRDMVTFMGARGLKANDAEVVYKLAPESFRLQQVVLLAREGHRLGQKEMDLKAWEFVFDKHNDPKIRLEAKVRMAQLFFDLKKSEQAAKQYTGALAMWEATGCTADACDDIYKGLRQYVIGWNRIEAQKPSKELIAAYQEYTKVFTTDADMMIWTAQAMSQNGQYKEASAVGLQISSLLAATKEADKLEKNLLLTIENAEKAKDDKLLATAQDDYLAKSVTRQKELDVQYQKAYAIYQKENYPLASEQLRTIALQPKGDAKIKIQAAELALDALALLKDDTKLQVWSKEFTAKFPAKKAEFASVYQKTVLNQSAVVAKTDTAAALVLLNQFDPATATADDKKLFLKNKILLSEKLNKIADARFATEEYLKITSLTKEEQQFALERKAWFAELELDFATALKATEALNKLNPTTSDQKTLKLALFAELAEKNPEAYYTQFLKQSQDKEKKALITLRLIRSAKNPEKELNNLKNYLSDQPAMLAQATLEVYVKTKNNKLLEGLVKTKHTNSDVGFAMADRILFNLDLQQATQKIAAHVINTKNTKTLSATLKERVKLLEKLDTLANQAIARTDWTSQLLSLDAVARENKRFYSEVLSLPTPEGLNDQEQQEYLGLLSQQVAPHQAKADQAEAKLKEFWADPSVSEKYSQAMAANPEWSSLIKNEVATLAAVAPADQKAKLMTVQSKQQLASTEVKPSLIELEKARLQLKANPFEITALRNILDLEKKAKSQAMVEYLESRIASLANQPATDAVGLKIKPATTKETK